MRLFGLPALAWDRARRRGYRGRVGCSVPIFGSLWAGAAVAGLITGAGEAAALVLDCSPGASVTASAGRVRRPCRVSADRGLRASDRAHRQPGRGRARCNGERVGMVVRTPTRGAVLARASAVLGRGYAFGRREALD